MSETDAFALAYGRLSATTVKPGARAPDRAPTSGENNEARPSLLLPRLALLRPQPARRAKTGRPDRPVGPT